MAKSAARRSPATIARVASFLVIAALLVASVTTSAFANHHDFNGLMHDIEKQYGVHHTRIPMLGMVMFFAKPKGVHTLKLATFEDFHPKHEVFGPDVQHMISEHFGPEWKPFVRTWSRDGEASFVYANSTSDKVELLVVALDKDDATVVQLNVDPDQMDEWLDKLEHITGNVVPNDEGSKKASEASHHPAAPNETK